MLEEKERKKENGTKMRIAYVYCVQGMRYVCVDSSRRDFENGDE